MVSNDMTKPKIIFRNYTPIDASLDTSATTADRPLLYPSSSSKKKDKRDKSVEKSTGKQQQQQEEEEEEKSRNQLVLEKALQQSEADLNPHPKTVPNNNSNNFMEVSKKVNWDLKRDIQKKMDKLEKRTQYAIINLLRERLQHQADDEEMGENLGGTLD